jgi:hypothetical protein
VSAARVEQCLHEFIHPVYIHLAALQIHHEIRYTSLSAPLIVQKTPNPQILDYSVDDNPMSITQVAFPPASRTTKTSAKIGRERTAAFEDIHATQ